MEEMVVLLDEQRREIGTQPKRITHHADTPLHLGFSCYVLDAAGRLLVTRRAVAKPSFGGVWTNTVCGHPAPGEAHADAVARRARFELGVAVHGVELVLPDFRYRAEQNGVVENEWCPVFAEQNGVVENEWCPVFLAVTDEPPAPEPSEVEEHAWTTWEQFVADQRSEPDRWSPWCREQAEQLAPTGLVERYRARRLAG